MEGDFDSESKFFIDKTPSHSWKNENKRELNQDDKYYEPYSKKRCFDKSEDFRIRPYENKQYFPNDDTDNSSLKQTMVYYENILKDLKKGGFVTEGDYINQVLLESEGKEVELSCHGLTSHCFEILLNLCENKSVIQRFMAAFGKEKISVCTSANASHITELLMHHAIKALQNWSTVMNSEESEEKLFVIYCIDWLKEFGNFVLENLDDCLESQYSCHVLCTLIEALSGNLTGNKDLMSKNLKNHKKEFHPMLNELNSFRANQEKIASLEQIPESFSSMLKSIYKALLNSEHLISCVYDSSAQTIIQSLLFALKKRHPKACKKMIKKIIKEGCLEKDEDNIPLFLVEKNASYVFDEMFKVADEGLQLILWNKCIADNVEKLIINPVGNFVIQRIFDSINCKLLFQEVCKCTWSLFDKIVECRNFGILVSMTSACNRLNAQQAIFMENIMKCLHCLEPVERQDLIIPLLLGFQKYENFMAERKNLKICLQGSLVAQGILKYQKPFKAVKSILSMSPEEIAFLAGHIQGCHVLNALFGSSTVGEKNKEKLLHHLQPVLVTMACDRNQSLTLARIWTLLSIKLKEIVARQLALQQNDLKSTKSGYAIFQKFGIPRLPKIQEWRQIQSDISCNKKSQK